MLAIGLYDQAQDFVSFLSPYINMKWPGTVILFA